MKKNKLNVDDILNLYNKGYGVEKIATELKVGKKRIYEFLKLNNFDTSKKRSILQKNYIVEDWKIEKYPNEAGFHYIAKYRDDGKEFNDYMNQGGFLTSYIKEKNKINIPTLYDRRKYYMETGNYWWEQWFDIIKVENVVEKRCPYCSWTTKDVSNKSGAFEMHLKRVHNKTKFDYLKEYPEDYKFFELVSKTLNRQMSKNPDEYVICGICGKKLSRIDSRHLNKHGITKKEYVEKYGETTSKKYHERQSELIREMNINLERSFISKPEQELIDWLNNNHVENKRDRKILNGREIDIFIPSKNIAIEFNGNKYHTEWFGGKTRLYHLNKTNTCKTKGVALIHIFEDEYFYKKEIVYNKLSHILGLQQNLPKIMGRKCTIKEVDKNVAKNFLTKYHIQGYDPSTVHYGAFYNDELIAVMSFLCSSKNGDDWELTRFASNYNYICQGVGGKIFNYFIKNNNPNMVKSFADRRWTINEENNLYIQLDFKFDSYTAPDYKYYNTNVDRYKRWHKFGFRKKILLKKYPNKVNVNMTETEMVKAIGYDKIWDCGLIKYTWYKSK